MLTKKFYSIGPCSLHRSLRSQGPPWCPRLSERPSRGHGSCCPSRRVAASEALVASSVASSIPKHSIQSHRNL